MAKNTTPNGKELEIRRNERGFFIITFTSGGELPIELQGIFTDSAKAERALNVYLNRKNTEQVDKNAKTSI